MTWLTEEKHTDWKNESQFVYFPLLNTTIYDINTQICNVDVGKKSRYLCTILPHKALPVPFPWIRSNLYLRIPSKSFLWHLAAYSEQFHIRTFCGHIYSHSTPQTSGSHHQSIILANSFLWKGTFHIRPLWTTLFIEENLESLWNSPIYILKKKNAE